MFAKANQGAALLALLSAILLLLSCSGSSAPQPGTPAFYWGAAQQTYAAGDYQKTIENLSGILSTQNEYVARALPWMLVLTSGMSRGYADYADAFEAGSHANHGQTTDFHRQETTARGSAGRMALQFAENFGNFKSTDEYVTLAFPYPNGSPTEVLILNQIAGGKLPAPAELDTAQKHAIEHAILLNTCAAVGAKGDPAKAQDLLKTGDAKVARATFIQAMAGSLYDESQLYTHNKLDDPGKLKIFCTRAGDALKQAPASKDSADLDKKIQAALKKVKT